MQTPLDTVNQLTRAINNGDLTAAVRLYEADAILVVRPGQVARGSAELREGTGEGCTGLRLPLFEFDAERVVATIDDRADF